MQIAGGFVLGVCFTLMVIVYSGAFDLLEQRDKLIKLARDVIKEQEFQGYAKCSGPAVGKLRKYLEGIK